MIRVLLAYLIFNTQEWANWIVLLVWAFNDGGVHRASLIAVIQLVPAAVLAPVVASLQGRLARGAALRLSYVVQVASQIVLGTAILADAPFSVVGVAAAVYSVSITFTRPAHNALMPALSETTEELTAGNVGSGAVEAAATFLGPIISGLVVVIWEPGGVVLAMAALTFVAMLVTAYGLDITDPDGASSAPTPDAATIREVLTDPSAAVLALMVASEFALIGMMDILLVVLAFDILDLPASGPGLLNSALGVGGMAGAGFTFLLIGRKSLAPTVILAAVATGTALAVAGGLSATVLVLALVAVSGAGKLFFDVACRTFLQRLLPDRLLVGVFGLTESLMMAGLAVGNLIAPLLVSTMGPRAAFVAAGSFLPAVSLLATARLRRMDAATVIPEDVVSMLRTVPALSVLAPRVLERLAIEANEVVVAAGEPVVTEGEPGRLFYVISSGSADVSRHGEQIRRLGPGDWFGELALLRNVPRTATVTAADEVHLWAVDRNAFLASVGATAGSLDAVQGHGNQHYI